MDPFEVPSYILELKNGTLIMFPRNLQTYFIVEQDYIKNLMLNMMESTTDDWKFRR